MPTEKKAQIIGELEEVFAGCDIGIMTDYRGLTTAQLSDLRRKLREAGTEYKVVKNTLARLALEKIDRSDPVGLLRGPIAIAFGHGDVTLSAKTLIDYINSSKSSLSIKGGFLASRVLSAADVESLARLPSREILLGKLFAGMQSPIVNLVNVLSSPIRGIMGVLQARIQQLEGE